MHRAASACRLLPYASGSVMSSRRFVTLEMTDRRPGKRRINCAPMSAAAVTAAGRHQDWTLTVAVVVNDYRLIAAPISVAAAIIRRFQQNVGRDNDRKDRNQVVIVSRIMRAFIMPVPWVVTAVI